jgi:rhodanese-related sulfurtransferase
VRRLVVLGIVGLLFAASAPLSLAAAAQATDVSVEQARKLIRERGGKAGFVVLDVRTPAEFSGGHLPGAVNLDIQARDFLTRLEGLDRGKSYLVYCRSGNRSAKAAQAMERMEFPRVYHMREGVIGWEKK